MTRKRKEALTALVFVSPWLIGFTVFLFYPLLDSVYFSLCDYSVLHKPVWIGMGNYTDLMHDEVFWITLKNTFVYAVIALPVGMLLALSLAMLLNAKVKGMAIYRTIFFVPSVVPTVSLAMLGLWIFNGQLGVVNHVIEGPVNLLGVILNAVHIGAFRLHTGPLAPPQWLSDPNWAKITLVLLGIWGAGNAMVIYLAGLQDVPQALYEAADLDGAGWWAKTWNVTLPMLSPVILFNLIMGIIGTLQVFTVPQIMFPGGVPSRSTYFYTMYLYDNAFKFLKMGYASAMGWIMFIIIMILTALALRISAKHVHYGGT